MVTATGDRTELGKIQSLVQETEQLTTPLQLQLEALTGRLITLSAGLGLGIFAVGLFRGYSFIEMLKMSLTLAVAAVPEGLPTVATISLTQSANRMKDRKVLVRTLGAVEALGSTQVICLDKTGTLTMNHMSVTRLVIGLEEVKFKAGKFTSLSGPRAGEELTLENAPSGLRELIEVGVLCNESEMRRENGESPTFKGSPTEVSLLELAHVSDISIDEVRARGELLETEYRTEERSYMVTEYLLKNGERYFAVKGNPEEVLALCDTYLQDGQERRLDLKTRAAIMGQNDHLGNGALRVLGLASAKVRGAGELKSGDLKWLGLIGMADQPREGIKELMASFHAAGIKTVMITGDQSATAHALGLELGISGNEELRIFDWSDVASVDPGELIEISRKTHVFARVSPSEKLQIVKALQATGNIVAMVGDGINDAPALKAADVGIAMGFNGTEVAREVADVVLMDDKLQSLLPGIELGRTTYDSIHKSVVYLITTNLSESLLMFMSMAIGWGQSLNSMQILWINLISDLFPAMALALELPESKVLERPPQPPHQPILKSEDMKQIAIESQVMSLCALLAYGYGFKRYGNTQRSQSIAFTSLAVAQLLHTLSARSDKRSAFDERMKSNKYVSLSVGAGLGLQTLPLIVPALRKLLHVSPLGVTDIGVSVGAALLNLLYNEAQVKKLNSH